jgi:HSP20 family molecular chaperone IbpA
MTAVPKQSITVIRTESVAEDLDRLQDHIRRRAYEIFLGRDRRAGSDFDDWLLAEQELVLRPAIELRQRDGHIELDALVTSGDPTDLDVRVGPQDILISSSTGSSQETRGAGAHVDELSARMLFGSVHLPTRIDPTTVEAEWRDGLLHLTAALAKEATTGSDTRPRSEA